MLDLVLITVCYYLAYRLRFEGEDLDNFLPYFTASLPVVLGCKLAALYASGLYQRSWDTFGLRDLTAVVRGVGLGSLLSVLTVGVPVSPGGILARRVRARRDPAGHRHRRHARVVPRDEPGGGDPQQAQPPRARLRRRPVRPDAGARDARQRAVEHEPGRVHRRRPDEGAALDHGRAGARHHRRARARDGALRHRRGDSQQPGDQRQAWSTGSARSAASSSARSAASTWRYGEGARGRGRGRAVSGSRPIS